MPLDIEFLKKVKNDYLFQDYANLFIRIVAAKKEEKYIIHFLRVEYSSESEEKTEIFYY